MTAKAYDRKGRLLAEANNSYKKTHPLQAHFANLVGLPQKVYLHAEIACLIVSRNKKVHSIHVKRENKHGRLLNAMPCKLCREAIRWYGVNNVFYTGDDGLWHKLEMKE